MIYRSKDEHREDLILVVHKRICVIVLAHTKKYIETQLSRSKVLAYIRKYERGKCQER